LERLFLRDVRERKRKGQASGFLGKRKKKREETALGGIIRRGKGRVAAGGENRSASAAPPRRGRRAVKGAPRRESASIVPRPIVWEGGGEKTEVFINS